MRIQDCNQVGLQSWFTIRTVITHNRNSGYGHSSTSCISCSGTLQFNFVYTGIGEVGWLVSERVARLVECWKRGHRVSSRQNCPNSLFTGSMVELYVTNGIYAFLSLLSVSAHNICPIHSKINSLSLKQHLLRSTACSEVLEGVLKICIVYEMLSSPHPC